MRILTDMQRSYQPGILRVLSIVLCKTDVPSEVKHEAELA